MNRRFHPAPEAIRRLTRVGWLALAVGAGFGLFVLWEGSAGWAQRLLALGLFCLPFLWGGWSFLREARALARAEVVLEDERLRYRLPASGRIALGGEEAAAEVPLPQITHVDYRQRPLLELIFLSALRPRGTFSRHVFVIHFADTDRRLELDPVLWPGIEALARELAERLSACRDSPSTPSRECVP